MACQKRHAASCANWHVWRARVQVFETLTCTWTLMKAANLSACFSEESIKLSRTCKAFHLNGGGTINQLLCCSVVGYVGGEL